jgi:hypothetical protein
MIITPEEMCVSFKRMGDLFVRLNDHVGSHLVPERVEAVERDLAMLDDLRELLTNVRESVRVWPNPFPKEISLAFGKFESVVRSCTRLDGADEIADAFSELASDPPYSEKVDA